MVHFKGMIVHFTIHLLREDSNSRVLGRWVIKIRMNSTILGMMGGMVVIGDLTTIGDTLAAHARRGGKENE